MPVLVGSTAATSSTDFWNIGDLQGSSYVAALGGTATSMSIEQDSGSTYTSLLLGIYADSAGAPGALLGVAVPITDNTAGIKSAALTSPVPIVVGATYWLASMPLGGVLHNTDNAGAYKGDVGRTSLTNPFGTITFTDNSHAVAISVSGTQGPYLNQVAIAAPRNGTTSHTVDPSSGTGLLAGTPFVPTAGRFLTCVCQGGVTFTTPSGWTLPTNGSAVNNSGLYLFDKTAAGADTIASTHNGSNYPAIFNFYEFPAGSTFVKAATAVGIGTTAANPTISALTGANSVFGAAAADVTNPSVVPTATWAGSDVKTLDAGVVKLTTDGYYLTICEQHGYVTATYAPTPTISGFASTTERLTWAINVPTPAIPKSSPLPRRFPRALLIR